MIAKRIFDLLFTIPSILILSPLFLYIALWIKRDSPGPVFYRQIRVGRFGKEFNVLKFRSMIEDAEKRGSKITIGGDHRITRSGRFLRKFKLDEFPQLLNVLKGEMSLVGPRPEVPEYVSLYSEEQKKIIFSVPPGMTDYASLEFRNENDLLANANDPQQEYIEKIMPIKLEYYIKYVSERSLWVDFCLILKTIKAVFC